MDRYSELQEAGRKLTPAQVEGQLRLLARDPRFAAVAAVVERNRVAWERAMADQRIAESHGKLAHAGGSVRAIGVLEGQLAAVINRPLRQRAGVGEGPPE